MNMENNGAKVKKHRIWDWILVIFGWLFMMAGVLVFVNLFVQDPSKESAPLVTAANNFGYMIGRYLIPLFFTATFLAIGVVLFISRIRRTIRKEKHKPVFVFSCGAMGVLLLTGLFCVMVVNNEPKGSIPQNAVKSPTNNLQPTYTPLPTFTAYPTYTLLPINTPLPTDTPGPTNTFGPTNTPRATNTPRPTSSPTVTPLPNLVKCISIVAKHDMSTDIQWQEYRDEVLGRNIYFSGKVRQVYEDNSASLNSNDECGITIYRIPHDVALRLYKGQQVEGYGTIKSLFWFLWVAEIDINIIPETLIVR